MTLGGTAASNVTVVNSTTITATTAAHAAGAVNVVVGNTDGQSGTLTNGYTYTVANPAPTVGGVAPTSGTTAGGTGITVTGTGFLAGATVTLGGTAASNVTVVNSTTITATTAAHAAGAVNVVVRNTDGQSGTLTNGYHLHHEHGWSDQLCAGGVGDADKFQFAGGGDVSVGGDGREPERGGGGVE